MSRKKRWLGILLCLCLVTLVPVISGGEEAVPKKDYGEAVGKYMKPFTLRSPVENGKEYNSSEFLGKPTLITFIQSACRLCQNEVRELNELYPSVKGKMNVVAVFLDVDPARLVRYKEAFSIPYLMLHDGDAAVAGSVGISSTPASVVLSADGMILKRESGYHTDMMKDMTTMK